MTYLNFLKRNTRGPWRISLSAPWKVGINMKIGTSIFLFISYSDHQANSSKHLFKVVRQSDLQKWLYWNIKKSWITLFLLSRAVYVRGGPTWLVWSYTPTVELDKIMKWRIPLGTKLREIKHSKLKIQKISFWGKCMSLSMCLNEWTMSMIISLRSFVYWGPSTSINGL